MADWESWLPSWNHRRFEYSNKPVRQEFSVFFVTQQASIPPWKYGVTWEGSLDHCRFRYRVRWKGRRHAICDQESPRSNGTISGRRGIYWGFIYWPCRPSNLESSEMNIRRQKYRIRRSIQSVNEYQRDISSWEARWICLMCRWNLGIEKLLPVAQSSRRRGYGGWGRLQRSERWNMIHICSVLTRHHSELCSWNEQSQTQD